MAVAVNAANGSPVFPASRSHPNLRSYDLGRMPPHPQGRSIDTPWDAEFPSSLSHDSLNASHRRPHRHSPQHNGDTVAPSHFPASTSSESLRSAATTTSSGSSEHGDSSPEESECTTHNDTNIYVSELPPTITLPKFRAMFAPFGVIIAARLVPRRKGYLPVGFVQFTTQESARTAISVMDRQPIGDTVITVRLARRDKDKGINNKPSTTLYVANLPLTFNESDLRSIFSHYGEVRSLLIFKQPDIGASKGSGLIRFTNLAGATAAKEALHCTQIPGHDLPMEVKYAESKHDKQLRSEGNAKRSAPKGDVLVPHGSPARNVISASQPPPPPPTGHDFPDYEAALKALGSGCFSAPTGSCRSLQAYRGAEPLPSEPSPGGLPALSLPTLPLSPLVASSPYILFPVSAFEAGDQVFGADVIDALRAQAGLF